MSFEPTLATGIAALSLVLQPNEALAHVKQRRRKSMKMRRVSEQIRAAPDAPVLKLTQVPAHWFNLPRETSGTAHGNVAIREFLAQFGQIRKLEVCPSTMKTKSKRKPSKKDRKGSKVPPEVNAEQTNSILLKGFPPNRPISSTATRFPLLESIAAESRRSSTASPTKHSKRKASVKKSRSTNQILNASAEEAYFVDIYVLFIIGVFPEQIAEKLEQYWFCYQPPNSTPQYHNFQVSVDSSGYFSEHERRRRQSKMRIQEDARAFERAKSIDAEAAAKKQAMVDYRECIASLEDVADQLIRLKERAEAHERLQHDKRLLNTLDRAYTRVNETLQLAVKTPLNEVKYLMISTKDAVSRGSKVVAKLDQTIKSMYMEMPSVAHVLEKHQTLMFLDLCKSRSHPLKFTRCTIFVPVDNAFVGSLESFEESCWNLHVLEGSYQAADLANFDAGRIQTRNGRDVLRVALTPEGKFQVWVNGDSDPPLKATLLYPNVLCSNGTVVHFVDRILYSVLEA